MSADAIVHPAPAATHRAGSRGGRSVTVAAIALTAVAAFVGGLGATASAAPGGDDTSVSVEVASVLDLTITSDPFALDGVAGAIVSLDDAVAYTVTSNDQNGYNVTVQAAADDLTGASTADGTDTIPVTALSVTQAGSAVVGPQAVEGTSGDPVELVTTTVRSASSGDNYTSDYSILIPNVTADTYTVALNYVVNVNV